MNDIVRDTAELLIIELTFKASIGDEYEFKSMTYERSYFSTGANAVEITSGYIFPSRFMNRNFS